MKLRSAVLVLASLLLAAGIAGAATSPAASSDGQAASSPGFTPISLDKPADCGFSGSTPAISRLTPARSPLSMYTFTCGSCSYNPCKGAIIGQICGVHGNVYGRCDSPYGNNCGSDDTVFQCQCWYGPLP
ncbi:MAG TPA: hypothetical protein VOA87_11040 [Thermoanaerobaculia bacterium]|nr:hypothetical protein [Thermoanaerobaculia bacterium]